MISDQEQRNAWLSFAAAAIASSGDADSVEDIVEDSAYIADEMLEKFLETFGPDRREEEERPRKGRRKR